MKPADLCDHPSQWFGGEGIVSDIVISSRVRLARNLSGYEFQPCLNTERKTEILDKLKAILLSADLQKSVFFVDIDHASHLEKEVLSERHLISRHLARGTGPRGVVISEDETFTAMINEEDHLRIQCYAPGLQLHDCWKRVNHIDDLVEQKVQYAFDSQLGYLTACPTNVGTGIRVSVMLHLPALKLTGQIDKFLNAAKDSDFAVRGLFGEGTDATGDFYQISNQVTLGISEIQIVEDFSERVVPKIIAYENAARQTLLDERTATLDDKVQRALGVLRSARLISSQEALYLLSNIRLGINMGRIRDVKLETINELFMLTQPAHLQIRSGKILEPQHRDTLRAEIIRNKIA